ncbi:hypothetical protein [Actinoplanes campanulatus]|uniref:hypothetical protein n=1 Tax=Actinoplanes campanulatus TaxID=113559 RepID=UPI001943F140|nr:hypothetical protein [Actinoplanes campanulatus]
MTTCRSVCALTCSVVVVTTAHPLGGRGDVHGALRYGRERRHEGEPGWRPARGTTRSSPAGAARP